MWPLLLPSLLCLLSLLLFDAVCSIVVLGDDSDTYVVRAPSTASSSDPDLEIKDTFVTMLTCCRFPPFFFLPLTWLISHFVDIEKEQLP